MVLKFESPEHRTFYRDMAKESGFGGDCYHKALFYTLGLTDETRRHVRALYDFAGSCIVPEGLHAPWQTGSSLRATQLAFNLFNNFCDENDPRAYTPYSLFCDALLPYFLDAVRLRYADHDR